MMKHVWLVAGAAAVAALCGCRHTHVDQVKAGDGLNEWYDEIRSNYGGYKPPRLISPRLSEESKSSGESAEMQIQPAGNQDIPEIKIADIPVTEPEQSAVAVEPRTPEVKDEAKPADKPVDPVAQKTPEGSKDQKSIEPPDPTSGDIYVVKSGDTLGALSKRFYGSVRYVNMLQKANSDIISNPNVLKPGMKLIIPKL